MVFELQGPTLGGRVLLLSSEVLTEDDTDLIGGDGPRWWDGEGSNGGKTKPKFFKAGPLTYSTSTALSIKNTPVQCFSVSSGSNIVLNSITTDNLNGDSQDGHNTDAFDVGTSTGVTISNANVKNQDDCLAINSGSDITFIGETASVVMIY